MKFKEVERILKRDGWIEKSINGSHYQYVHPIKKGKVTVPRHGNQDISIGTLKSIFKCAGIKDIK